MDAVSVHTDFGAQESSQLLSRHLNIKNQNILQSMQSPQWILSLQFYFQIQHVHNIGLKKKISEYEGLVERFSTISLSMTKSGTERF